MFGLRGQELLIILLIILLVFGAAKLPALARSLGASAKEFRKGVQDGSETDTEAQASETQQVEPPAAETPVQDTKKPD